MTEFKEVSMSELNEWVAAYPRKLERNVFTAGEPPLVMWNDFERAPLWPASIVAKHFFGSDRAMVLADIAAVY